MATNIEWASTKNKDGSITKGQTWNPTTGCFKISQGCKNCYAEIMHKRLTGMGQKKYQRKFNEGAFLDEDSLSIPLKRKKQTTWFVNSMSDLFHESLSMEDIAKCYAIMFLCPQHTFQVLTKRADIRLKLFSDPEFLKLIWQYTNIYHDKYINKLEQELYFYDEVKAEFPFKNIHEGTSIENNDTLHRADDLRNTPAIIRFISAEPLLESIADLNLAGIDQIIVGGESGHKKRPFNADWARELRDKCKTTGTKFFMKQMDKVQKIPKDLMIREYPKVKKLILK